MCDDDDDENKVMHLPFLIAIRCWSVEFRIYIFIISYDLYKLRKLSPYSKLKPKWDAIQVISNDCCGI